MRIRFPSWLRFFGLFALFVSSNGAPIREPRRDFLNVSDQISPIRDDASLTANSFTDTLSSLQHDKVLQGTLIDAPSAASKNLVERLLNDAIAAYTHDDAEVYQRAILNPQVLEQTHQVRTALLDEKLPALKRLLKAYPQFLQIRLPYLITKEKMTYLTIWECAAIEGKIISANYLEQRLLQQKVSIEMSQMEFTQTLSSLLENGMEVSPYAILIAAAKGWHEAVDLYRTYLKNTNQADLEPASQVPLTFLALAKLKEQPQMRFNAFKMLLDFVDPNLSIKLQKPGYIHVPPDQVPNKHATIVEQSLLDICVGNNFVAETLELLKRGARTDIPDEIGLFPIDVAAIQGNWPIVFSILENGHSVTKVNGLGNKFFDTLVAVARSDRSVLTTLANNEHTKKYVAAIQARLRPAKYSSSPGDTFHKKSSTPILVVRQKQHDIEETANRAPKRYMR